MLRTNRDQVVKISVQGEISAPIYSNPGKLDSEGRIFVLPGTGGITYNVKIGDPACGFECDHVEPGVSTKNYDEMKNNAYNYLSCIGNEATIITGDGKGAKGFVTGTHGGIEHVIMYFDPAILDTLNIGDKVNVKAYGQGLKLLDYPEITVKNLDPDLLDKLNIEEKSGKLIVPVAKKVPAPTPPTKAITTSACLTMPRWRNMACGICGWGISFSWRTATTPTDATTSAAPAPSVW